MGPRCQAQAQMARDKCTHQGNGAGAWGMNRNNKETSTWNPEYHLQWKGGRRKEECHGNRGTHKKKGGDRVSGKQHPSTHTSSCLTQKEYRQLRCRPPLAWWWQASFVLLGEGEANWYCSQLSHHHLATKPRLFSLLSSSASPSHPPVLVLRCSDGVGSGVPVMGSWSTCPWVSCIFLPCLNPPVFIIG